MSHTKEALNKSKFLLLQSMNACRLSRAFLLGVVLFLTQLGLLAHAIDHEFDEPHGACIFCQMADHLGDAVPSPGLLKLRVNTEPDFGSFLQQTIRQVPKTAFFARGPPSFPRI